MTNPPAQAFLEAVQLRAKMALRTEDPELCYRSVVVKPHWIGTIGLRAPALWAYAEGLTNHDFPLSLITEWAVLGPEDLTSRTLHQKRLHDFGAHPFLGAMDRNLRGAWAAAAQRPDFDLAALLALDERLAALGAAVAAWTAEVERIRSGP